MTRPANIHVTAYQGPKGKRKSKTTTLPASAGSLASVISKIDEVFKPGETGIPDAPGRVAGGGDPAPATFRAPHPAPRGTDAALPACCARDSA